MLWLCPRGFPGLFLVVPFLAFLSPRCPAQQVSTQVSNGISAYERTLAAESFAAERLYNWQKRLNLQDWKISVIMSRAAELRPRTLGNIHWDLARKTAVIRVLDPADYHMGQREMLDDMEFTVVHELLHLGFAPVLADLARTDANRREEEHTVNDVTQALLILEHGK